MRIIIDAMGGDNAPEAIVRGAIKASKKIDHEIVLIGKEDVVKHSLKKHGEKKGFLNCEGS